MRRAIVAGVLAIHIVLLLDGAWRNFVTVDESALIAAGLAHWETGQYGVYRVNPPLPRMMATLPVHLGGAGSQGASEVAYEDVPAYRSEWRLGDALAQARWADYLGLVRLSRLAGVFWSLLGAWVIYRWAGELYGPWAGCLGLVLWCFGPNILAHAELVTADVPATTAGLAATYAFWRYLPNPTWWRALVAGLLLGLCQLTKFTLLVFYGVWPLLWLIHRLWPPGDTGERTSPVRTQLGQGAVLVLLSLLVINLGYEFKDTCWRLEEYPFVSRLFAGSPPEGAKAYVIGTSGNRFRDSRLGRIIVPLPADYVRGIDVQRRDFETLGKRMPSYLAGEWRDAGWWYYYLYALAVKVPLGVWALVAWGIVLTLRGHPSSARWQDELTLWVPALTVLILVSSQTGFNHHMRYVLPLFPFVVVSTSKVGYFLRPARWKAGLAVVAFLGAAVVSSLWVHPHYLSYFNELAGGPDNGHNHLLNSNIDWGQDLLFLKDWLDEHPEAKPVGLAYFNLVDPRIAGVEFTLPPYGPAAGLPDDEETGLRLGPQPGYYAVSVNYLHGFSFPTPDGKGGRVGPPGHAYEYFQHFRPIAKAGYSIFIYRVTLQEANRVREEYDLPLLQAGQNLPPVD